MAIGWHELRREPYRVLFPLGAAFGCLGVSHWLFYATGALPSASAFFHASIQTGAYLYCFITGFLWTAMPRMASAPPASSAELLILLGLLGAQTGLLALGRTQLAQLCFAGLLALLLAFAARRFRAGAGPSGEAPAGPVEFIWVPIGAAFGLMGSLLLAAGPQAPVPFWLARAGRVMAQQGFILSVVLGVAGFLAPRLLGRGFTPAGQAGAGPGQVRRARRRRLAIHLMAAGLLAVSFAVEGAGFIRPAYALRAMVVTAELAWTAQWWKAPAITDLYVRLLWLSLWFVIGGLWAAACWPKHRLAMLHLVLIGGFSLMVFSVATMVVLSHAGQAAALRKPLWMLRVVAAGVTGALLARIAADLWPARYFALLAASASLWLLAGISWLVFSLPLVLRATPPEEFERMHQEAKQRLLREHAPNRC